MFSLSNPVWTPEVAMFDKLLLSVIITLLLGVLLKTNLVPSARSSSLHVPEAESMRTNTPQFKLFSFLVEGF